MDGDEEETKGVKAEETEPGTMDAVMADAPSVEVGQPTIETKIEELQAVGDATIPATSAPLQNDMATPDSASARSSVGPTTVVFD